MSLKVLTDEHNSPTVAHRLVSLGFDVICVLEEDPDRTLTNSVVFLEKATPE